MAPASVPANCGGDNTTKPVGYWVANKPTVGTRDTDWAEERFGGFYAGKYEASRSDATPGDPTTGAGATAGSSSTLRVARYCVPWTNVDWDTAAKTCLAYDAHAHLMRDEEWTALAVWATINGVAVYGNNAEWNPGASYTVPSDIDNSGVTFVDDPSYAWAASGKDRALTGSATSSAWEGTTNLATITGTTAGVHDLNGNVWEWTETVGHAQTTGNYIVNDTVLPLASPAQGYVDALSTDGRIRRLGLPAATHSAALMTSLRHRGRHGGRPHPLHRWRRPPCLRPIGARSFERRYQAGANASFGGDYLYRGSLLATMKCLRGGSWDNGAVAGLWLLQLGIGRDFTGANAGFRPALRF